MPPKQAAGGGEGDDDDEEKTGIALLLQTVWQEAFAYQSVKIIKIPDWRLTFMNRMFTLGVFIYILFTIFLNHGYFLKQQPHVTVDPILADEWTNGTIPDRTNLARFPYCAPLRFDYAWSDDVTYLNNSCIGYLRPEEYYLNTFRGIFVMTAWTQQLLQRNCSVALTPAPPPPEDIDESVLPPLPPMPCEKPTTQANQNAFIVGPELSTLEYRGTYITTWGRTRSAMHTTIVPRTGIVPLNGTEFDYAADEPVRIQVDDLLRLAGIDLDGANVMDDGGLPGQPPLGWPSYRLTGVEVAVNLKYGNFKENGTIPDPFNFEDYLVMEVFPVTKGTFATATYQLWYLGKPGDGEIADSKIVIRAPRGVQITLVPAGQIGIFDGITLLFNLVNILALTALTGSLTDTFGKFLLEGFREKKYQDDLELRIRTMLRQQLTDSPTLDQILAYEQEQIEIHESRQKRAIELRQIKENEKKLKQQRIIMEKYLGVKPKRKAAVDPLNAEGAAGEEDAGEVDSELDGRGATLRTAKIPAGLKGLEPRIETLVIAGELKHGRSVTAQGFLENCRCVRFQWATSSDGKRFTRVPGATMPTFFLTFGDLGHFVEVEATPVADDGFEGRPLKARAGPIATAKEMAAEVKRNVQEAKRNAFLFEEGVFVGGARAILRLRNFDVSLTSPSKMEVGAITLGGTIVVASRNDVHALEIRDPSGPTILVDLPDGYTRDVAAMMIKELNGGAMGNMRGAAHEDGPKEAAAESLAPTESD